MDRDRWAVIESLYHAVLAKEPSERSSYLAAACAGDPILQSEVESLLAYADRPLLSSNQRFEIAKLLGKTPGIPTSDTLTSSPDNEGNARLNVRPPGNVWVDDGIDHCTSGGTELVGEGAAAPPPALPATI